LLVGAPHSGCKYSSALRAHFLFNSLTTKNTKNTKQKFKS
jgi:hypothetical protein